MAPLRSRSDLARCRRVVIKVGTSVVTGRSGRLALGRVGNLVEQIAELHAAGIQVILLSSGSIGLGQQRLYQQSILSAPLRAHVNEKKFATTLNERAAAASGQSALMAHYSAMFAEFAITVSQVLLTEDDFGDGARRASLTRTLQSLLDLGVVPIVNENDVISTRATPTRDNDGYVFWDNDSLALLVAAETDTDAIFLLTDVDGLFDAPPDPAAAADAAIVDATPADVAARGGPRRISVYRKGTVDFSIGAKSRVGRGGMQAKVDAAMGAVERGVGAVIIASGMKRNTVLRCLRGDDVGTLFVADPAEPAGGAAARGEGARTARETGEAARQAGRALAALPDDGRRAVLRLIADRLVERAPALLEANAADVEAAAAAGMDPALRARLGLSEAKLRTLAAGIRALAAQPDPVGRVVRRTRLADGLELAQETVPLGVLLIIFESRPDALPQIAALAIRSGNALLLKGGKEAARSNAALHELVVGCLEEATRGEVSRDAVALVGSRAEVAELLELHDVIDLVIPRGSGRLVRDIQEGTRIPVLGHAEGVCHIFVDAAADPEKALRVVVDGKTNYPAACNAMETLLVHRSHMGPGRLCGRLVGALREAGVALFGDEEAQREFGLARATSLSEEYGDLRATVAVVGSVDDAVRHIHAHGSRHTDVIVTEDGAAASRFLSRVDSACVFHNASPRFADGYRMGLGAEVGISTGKIHARGPVGVDGLTSTRWRVVSTAAGGHTADDFAGDSPRAVFTHESLPLSSRL